MREFFLLFAPGAGESVQLNKIKNELARYILELTN